MAAGPVKTLPKKVSKSFKLARKDEEIRVYMDPPEKMAGCDTDRDSGNKKFTCKYLFLFGLQKILYFVLQFYFIFVLFLYLDNSDNSDEQEGLVRHLHRQLLNAGAQKRTMKCNMIGNRLEPASSDAEDDKVPANNSQWTRENPRLIGSRVPSYIKPEENEAKLERLKTATAMEYYKVNKNCLNPKLR
jgi:hypothetical protein